MNKHDLYRLYAMTPVWAWPILWWRLVALRTTLLRLDDEGYAHVYYTWNVTALAFEIKYLLKDDTGNGDTPLTALAPRMEYIFALAGYMPETLWALHFNFICVHRAIQRGLGKLRLTPQPPLEPG